MVPPTIPGFWTVRPGWLAVFFTTFNPWVCWPISNATSRLNVHLIPQPATPTLCSSCFLSQQPLSLWRDGRSDGTPDLLGSSTRIAWQMYKWKFSQFENSRIGFRETQSVLGEKDGKCAKSIKFQDYSRLSQPDHRQLPFFLRRTAETTNFFTTIASSLGL